VTRWRWAIGTILLVLVALPLAMPLVQLPGRPDAWRVWNEGDRLLSLSRNTLLLVAGTLSLALPAGLGCAVLLERTDLPLRGLLRSFFLLILFIPLPLLVSGWQAALGSDGWLPVAPWSATTLADAGTGPLGIAWKPWAQGLSAAIWVHAMAGLPWVVLLSGLGLRSVERELEEDALTVAPAWRVLLWVSLPRSRAAIAAAGLWVAVQTMGEITVTDMMQVRTFAEEVYNQLTRPGAGAADLDVSDLVARAVVISLPSILLIFGLVLGAVGSWARRLPARESMTAPPLVFRLGWYRWLCFILIAALLALLAGIPVASLVWRAGLGGVPRSWSLVSTLKQISMVARAHGQQVGQGLLASLLGGGCTAVLGLLICWLAAESQRFRFVVIGLLTAAWALPGPLVGLGLKDTIAFTLKLLPFPPLAVALYYGPSPLPVVWAHAVRFLPCAVALLWPVVRLFPTELRDSARMDGARPWQELWYVVAPLFLMATVRAGLAVAVLSLGELGAGKLVETPGWQPFATQVFTQMHFGITSNLAALCLVLMGEVIVGWGLVMLVWRGARVYSE
jgi:iron(III) transport system permease protein